MARVPKDKEKSGGKCFGGQSYGCRHDEHKPGKAPDIFCMKCKTRMGCSLCCERPRELLCMVCNEWAHLRGLAAHGHIVDRGTVRSRVQAIIRELMAEPPF